MHAPALEVQSARVMFGGVRVLQYAVLPVVSIEAVAHAPLDITHSSVGAIHVTEVAYEALCVSSEGHLTVTVRLDVGGVGVIAGGAAP